jgi:hypothetical protein
MKARSDTGGEGLSQGDHLKSVQPTTDAAANYQPDVVIFLILIPIISGINYYLTYSNVRLNWFFALTFCLDTAQGYAAWWVVKRIIQYLDKVLPFEERFVSRLIVQLSVTTISGLAVIAVLTEIASLIVKGRTAPLNFYTVDLVIISIWFFVINGIYVALHYVNLWKGTQMTDGNLLSGSTPSEPPISPQSEPRELPLIARVGRETLKLEPDQLSGLYVDDNYVVAVAANGKKHYLDQSLDKIERTLPAENFFRVNRQYILNRSAISGFRRLDNGKLSVLIKKNEWLPPEVPMSRTRAAAFKEWFRVAD